MRINVLVKYDNFMVNKKLCFCYLVVCVSALYFLQTATSFNCFSAVKTNPVQYHLL